MDCAFKLFKKSMFDKVKLTSSKGFVDPELFIKAEHYHLKIKQLGVQHYKRFEGRALFQANKWGMIKFSVIKDLVKEMLELKEEMKTLK